MLTVCRIDCSVYACVTEDITTDEVVFPEAQIRHVQDRHPDDFAEVLRMLGEALQQPDYILQAKAREARNTALVLKSFEASDRHCEIVIRLQTSADPQQFKNAVISFWKISQARRDQYLRNKKVLYKRPGL